MLALLAGITAAGAAFLRSGARVNKLLREWGFQVSGGFTAVLAVALILFGVLLIAHDLAGQLSGGGWTMWAMFSVLILLVAASAVIVNLNHISLGRFYRDRLMEAFMPGYEQALVGTTGAAPAESDEMRLHQRAPAAPYQIVNTNVVLVNAKDRRRCVRGGDNFILTPEWCGSNATGWCRTRAFMGDGMTLATAMAISGAAANPNTGVGGVGLTRSRVVSVLMALLNLRLGYWVPNPGPRQEIDGTWSDKPGAEQDVVPNHLRPGFSALLRGYREDYPFQELTDGGHFENLGIYELIRRRARLILVCDGGQDPGFGFEDLQTALRRVGEDFGAKIEFDPDYPMTDMMSRLVEDAYPRGLERARRGFAVARVHYPPDFDEFGQIKDEARPATLIYLKTTLVDGLPLELLGYRGKNPDFPDQSTGDQFFDEDQFEAYRELGFRIAKAMIEDGTLGLPPRLASLHRPATAAEPRALATGSRHP
jgi:hypothetical protein